MRYELARNATGYVRSGLQLFHDIARRRCFMKAKKINAVEMKRRLQKETEERLSHLSEKEQLSILRKKSGHLMKRKRRVHFG